MKIKIGVFVAVLAFTATLGAMPRPAEASQITLTYAFFAPSGTFPARQMEHWANEVNERTDGQVRVQTFPGGSLLGARDMYEGVRRGVADIGLSAPAYDPGRFPLSSGLTLPHGFPNATVASLTYWDLMQEMQAKEFDNFRVIALFTSEPAYVQSRRAVNGLDDMRNLQLRATGSGVPSLEALGASPVGMPMPSVPEALQTGVIEGVATSREVLRDFRLAENVKYVTDYPIGVVTFAALMDERRWERLPENVQQVIDELGREMALWTGQYHDQHTADSISWSQENYDLQVISLSDEERATWDERLQSQIDDWRHEAAGNGLPSEQFLTRLQQIRDEHAEEYQ
ncbi:TRAP transporter substrate-binding protein [Halomonas sp. H5]|uniref:TRAP transporter substrate-binding protein n=1 Tax=Halomonas sp. H5 TaxID=3423910 RepID=UPI003D35D568